MEGRQSQSAPEDGAASRRWSVVTLDELCEITSGITKGRRPPVEPLRDVPYMAVINVQDGRLNLETVKTILASSSEVERYQLIPGDLLLTEGGDPDKLGRGTVWNAEIEVCIHQNHIFRVRAASPLIDMGYLSRIVASPDGKAYFLSKAKQTTGIASINLTQLRTFPVPLPPLNEQRRIAAKLDTTLAAVEACRQRLDGVAAILKRFRQAVLAAATSGELTREWREASSREQDWEPSSIKSIAEVGTGSTPLRSNQSFYSADGMPWITSAATSEELITTANEFVTESGIKSGRLRIFPEGTLLVAMYGEGKTRGQVSELGIAATINQACAAIHSPSEQHLMPFIKIALKANYLEMRQLAKGGNQPNLNLSKIKEFPIRVPPKDEVFEICEQVELLFSLADQLEAKLTTARKIVDRLTPALLAKAFRGELVPQDPSDEPASVLLERIRAARQAETADGKPARRGRKKAATHPDQLPLDAAPVPPDLLSGLLHECGVLSERALLAASELDPERFRVQLELERARGAVRETHEDGQVLLEAVG
jgi:type I restriction enzyme, S subunit